MMIEFEDRDEEQQRMFLEYLNRLTPEPASAPCSACLGRGCEVCSHTGLAEHMPREAPTPGCLWRFVGRLYLAWLRWRYRHRD